MSRNMNMELEECLIDKSDNAFTSLPEFAECIALVHKFSKLLNISQFTCFDLELALQQETTTAQNMHIGGVITRSPLLENFIAEQLQFFGKRFDRSNMYKKLYFMLIGLNVWSMPKFDKSSLLPPKEETTGNKDESKLEQNEELEMEADEEGSMGENPATTKSREPSVSETSQKTPTIQYNHNAASGGNRRNLQADRADIRYMTAEHKLKLMCFLIDAQLACAENTGHLDQEFPPEAQRIQPLVIDSAGRKFWYFCDTWLFMEEGQLFNAAEEEEACRTLKAKLEEETKKQQKANGSKDKGKERLAKKNSTTSANMATMKLTQRDLDDVYSSLFTGQRLRVVCKCSEHFVALIEAYKKQRSAKQNNSEVIQKLEECLQTVQGIEQERLRKLAEEQKRSASPARHSNRIAGILEKRRLEEENRRKKQLELLAERKQLEQEQAEFLREHRRLTDSNLRLSTMSREDRLKLRQQRIQEQLDRDELIAAGLFTPSPSTVTENDEEEASENGSIGLNGGRKRRQPPSSVQLLKKFSRKDDSLSAESGEALMKVPRMPAMDWWKPIISPTSNGPIGGNDTFESMFRNVGKSPMKSRYSFRPAPPPKRIFGDQETSAPRTLRRSLIATSSTSSNLQRRFPQSQIMKPADFQLPADFASSTPTMPSTSSRYVGDLTANWRTNNQRPNGLELKHGGGFDGIRAALNLRAMATNQFPTTSMAALYNNSAKVPTSSTVSALPTSSTTQANNPPSSKFRWAAMNPAIVLGSQCKYKQSSLADLVGKSTNNEQSNPAKAPENGLGNGNGRGQSG